MHKGGHLLNAVLLSIGIGVALEPAGNLRTVVAIVGVTPPIVLGAVLPDVDTAVGRHRKTLHNLGVLAFFLVYPVFFGNLQYVWIGVFAHYVLDLFGGTRGLALLYPLDREFTFPIALSSRSITGFFVILVVTGLEIAAAGALVSAGLSVADAGSILPVGR